MDPSPSKNKNNNNNKTSTGSSSIKTPITPSRPVGGRGTGEVISPLTGYKRHVIAVDNGKAKDEEEYAVVKSYTQRRKERLRAEHLVTGR